MITAIVIYVLVIFALSLITVTTRQILSGLTLITFKSSHAGTIVYAIIYFPGTIIHEISHFLFAAFLGVRTGQINLFPRAHDDGQRLELGSVQIAKTDFVRSSLIGAAPFITGNILLVYLIAQLGLTSQTSLTEIPALMSAQMYAPLFWFYLYGILAISNTLFTSKEDRRHWPVFAAIVAIIAGILALANIRLVASDTITLTITRVLNASSLAFLAAIMVNSVLLIVFYGLLQLLQKITRTKIIYK